MLRITRGGEEPGTTSQIPLKHLSWPTTAVSSRDPACRLKSSQLSSKSVSTCWERQWGWQGARAFFARGRMPRPLPSLPRLLTPPPCPRGGGLPPATGKVGAPGPWAAHDHRASNFFLPTGLRFCSPALALFENGARRQVKTSGHDAVARHLPLGDDSGSADRGDSCQRPRPPLSRQFGPTGLRLFRCVHARP